MDEWPNANDYTIAIQNPHICFRDSDLRQSAVERHLLTRMPKVWTGNFAQVYEVKNPRRTWAVKCFTRSAPDIRQRYEHISDTISKIRLPYFVEFHLLDNEMLVNGRRYPVVKMEWVEGQTLDKYVEANLYKPLALLELASRLVDIVKALESNGIAHGDLQHGNILIRGTEIKFVDYDGMFLPVFAGTLAPEQGLPSYQHPRRDARFYNAKLDRFPLLVLCTGLCALAVDPTLWYEFSTGDNLLFRREDFANPDRSPLFKRISAVGDKQVEGFAQLLRAACRQDLNGVALPHEPISLTTTRAKPWWVTIQPAEPAQGGKKAPAARAGRVSWDDLSSQLTRRWSAASGVTALVGTIALYAANVIGGNHLTYLSISTLILYLLERYKTFHDLPVFARRQALSGRIDQLRSELAQKTSEQGRLQSEPARLSQLEAQEKANAYRDLKERELASQLSRIDVSRLTQIKGIGPYILDNLRAAGFTNACQLYQKQWWGVRGIGSKRGQQIRGLLSRWKAEAEHHIPTALPLDVAGQIERRYQQQRQVVVNQLGGLGQRINGIRTEVSQGETELKQLYVPSFGEFLKHNF